MTADAIVESAIIRHGLARDALLTLQGLDAIASAAACVSRDGKMRDTVHAGEGELDRVLHCACETVLCSDVGDPVSETAHSHTRILIRGKRGRYSIHVVGVMAGDMRLAMAVALRPQSTLSKNVTRTLRRIGHALLLQRPAS